MGDTVTDKPTNRQSPNYTPVTPPPKPDEPPEEVAYSDDSEPKKVDEAKPDDREDVNWGMVIPIAVCTLAVIVAAVALAIEWLGPWVGLAVSAAIAGVAFLGWWVWGRFRRKGRERRKARRRERRAARAGTGMGFDWNPAGGAGTKKSRSGRGSGKSSGGRGKGTGNGKSGGPKGSGKSGTKPSKGDRLASLLPGTRQNRNKKNGVPLSTGGKPKGNAKGGLLSRVPGTRQHRDRKNNRAGTSNKRGAASRTPGLPKGTRPKRGGFPKFKSGKAGLFGKKGKGFKPLFGTSSKSGGLFTPSGSAWRNTKKAATATGSAVTAAVNAIKPAPHDSPTTPGWLTRTASHSKGKTSKMSKKESNMLALSRQMIDGAKKEHKHELEGLFYQLVEEIDGTFANLAEVMKITGEQAVERNSVLIDLKPFAEGINALYKYMNEGRPLAQALDNAVKKSRRYQEFRTRMEDVNGASRDVTANRKAM